MDAASKQFPIQRAILRATRSHPQEGPARPAKITLNTPLSRPEHKRKIHIIVEPLRGSDAPGDTATIHRIFARSEPRCINHGRGSTWIEESLVRWEPKTCTFGDALDQYRLGFDIVSITSLEENIPSHSLQPFVSAKRLDRVQRRLGFKNPKPKNLNPKHPATAAANNTWHRPICPLSIRSPPHPLYFGWGSSARHLPSYIGFISTLD